MTRLLSAALLLAFVAMSAAANNTTVAPTAVPATSMPLSFIVNNSNGTICLRMSGYMNMTFNYTNGVNKTSGKPTYMLYTVPVAARESNNSFCSNDPKKDNKALLVLTWNSSYTLEFQFMEDVKNKNWSLSMVKFDFDTEFLPNYTNRTDYTHLDAVHAKHIFDGVALNESFQCKSNLSYPLNISSPANANKTITVELFTMDWRVQAFSFKNTTNGTYDNSKLCDADAESRSKVVPIAVGCALAGLVIIVLVAYLIGRFRSRKHESYETLS